MNVPYLLQNQYFKNDASTQEHTAQLDYTNPINSIHSIETGIKYIFRRSKSDGKYYLADKTGEYKYDQDMSTQYDHKQDILAAYLGYQLKYKNSVERREFAMSIHLWMRIIKIRMRSLMLSLMIWFHP